MKKIAFSLLLLFFFHQAIAQVIPPSRQQELWQKSKQQRTIGWVLLGGGAAIGAIGLIVFSNHVVEDIFTGKESIEGVGATIAGITLMAGSVPFFIMAGKNRRLSLSATSFQKLTPEANEPLLTLRQRPGLQLTFSQKLF